MIFKAFNELFISILTQKVFFTCHSTGQVTAAVNNGEKRRKAINKHVSLSAPIFVHKISVIADFEARTGNRRL